MIIPQHETWDKRDSSKLDEYVTCPRKFFYRYLLGWTPDVPAHDLHFGEAWHKGREYQRLFGYDAVEGAFGAFEATYRKYFDMETDSIYLPKTPTAALRGFMEFASNHLNDLTENSVVELGGKKMTEISGTVPISDNRLIYYKMDCIAQRHSDGMFFAWDDKSTSGKWIHDTRWDQEFFLSIQNGTYTHCLYCLFPIDKVLGVEFIKTGFEFLQRGSKARTAGYHATVRYIPAFKNPEQMNTWLWLVNNLYDEIDRDMDRLSQCKEEDVVMQAFRQNPKSCTAYKGCPFLDFCLAWQNPLQHCSEPPLGYRQEFWDPSKMETTVKQDLTWK